LGKKKLLEESSNNDFILLGSRDLKQGEQKALKYYSQIIMVLK
jgi:hypothetical protein